MVSIVIINYNSEKLLESCLQSLKALKYSDKEIIFLDNASTDASVKFVIENYPDVTVIANTINSGYAGAANQAFEISKGDYILIMNPDIIFEPDYLKILVDRLESDERVGAIIGKLRKYDFESSNIDLKSGQRKTNLIDSAGLVMYRNRRCVDRGQGEEDTGQYDVPQAVFGITGACPLYRRAAMEDIRIGAHEQEGTRQSACGSSRDLRGAHGQQSQCGDAAAKKVSNKEMPRGEIFDTDFFMYKEDVDVSWRLNLRGWKCFYEPSALAFHGRGTGAVDRETIWSVAKNRKSLSKFQKYHSYKNERLMRIKNDQLKDILRDFFPIVGKEILMTGWMILREPYLFKSFGKFLWQLPSALLKRREIMRKAKIISIKNFM